MPKPFVIDITIDGQKFLSADPVRCHPARRLIFMIHNEDAQSYDVTIDPTTDIFEKEDVGAIGAAPVNPTTAAAAVTVTVTGLGTAGSSKPIKCMLKPKAQFG